MRINTDNLTIKFRKNSILLNFNNPAIKGLLIFSFSDDGLGKLTRVNY